MDSALSHDRATDDEPAFEWCFDDRCDAGRLLGAQLRCRLDAKLAAITNVVAVAGGGVVVGAEVARTLDAPLAVVPALGAGSACGNATEFHGGTVVVVDDGVVTGRTMVDAIRWSRARGARRVVVAVPVAAPIGLARVRAEADTVVWGHVPGRLQAVADWYEEFPPVSREEELQLVDGARRRHHRRTKQTIGRTASRLIGTARLRLASLKAGLFSSARISH